jgi:hypothetical protein
MSVSDLRAFLTALGFAIAVVGALMDAAPAAGEDFRIDNKVYAEGRKEPMNVSTSIFQGGVLFDFMQQPEEITILDRDAKRFVLLDVRRKIRTELPLAAVTDFAERLKQKLEESDDPFVKFQVDPKFEEKFNPSTGELTLTSPWMTYRIQTQSAESREMAAQYREASDWLTRLNTVLNPGARLPSPRLLVNEALAKRDLMAREVHLTTTAKKSTPPKRIVVRSEHQLARQLTEADQTRVKQARQYAAEFRTVVFSEYRKPADR